MTPQSDKELAAASKVWSRAIEQLAVLELIAGSGCVFSVKVDGEREHERLTVMLTGGPLGEHGFRRDGEDLVVLLEAAIAHFAEHAQK